MHIYTALYNCSQVQSSMILYMTTLQQPSMICHVLSFSFLFPVIFHVLSFSFPFPVIFPMVKLQLNNDGQLQS